MDKEALRDWVQAARRGDPLAQARLFDFLRKELCPLVRSRVPQMADADDVMADTLSRVLGGLGELHDDEKLLPFAGRIARRALTDWRRRQPRGIELTDVPHQAALDPALRILESEELLLYVQERLTADENRLLEQGILLDKPRENAPLAGISLNAMSCRLYRLRKKVQAILRPFLGGHGLML